MPRWISRDKGYARRRQQWRQKKYEPVQWTPPPSPQKGQLALGRRQHPVAPVPGGTGKSITSILLKEAWVGETGPRQEVCPLAGTRPGSGEEVSPAPALRSPPWPVGLRPAPPDVHFRQPAGLGDWEGLDKQPGGASLPLDRIPLGHSFFPLEAAWEGGCGVRQTRA